MGVERRFKAWQTQNVDGIWFRLVPGKKGPDDLRLDWRINGEWRPVGLSVVAFIIDAIADNENALYPPPAAGGAYVYRFLRQALKEGWRKASVCLDLQRAKKHNPRSYGLDGDD